MAYNVGIDLGTTNSVCCLIENGQFRFIKFGSRDLLPSTLMYKDAKTVIGEKAKRKAVLNPENYIESSKTFMGDISKLWNIDDKSYTPTDVAAEILKEIRTECVKVLGSEEISAVITVPAYFTSNQIDETRKAGEAAGFIVKQIITEPVAAAVAYGFEESENQTLYVVDIGGGTFDVSILKVKGHNFSSIGISGDKKLGGDDFDHLIMEIFFSAIRKSAGVDMSSHTGSGLSREDYYSAKQKLRVEAEKCKIELSSADNYEIEIPDLFKSSGGIFNFSYKMSRAEFEDESKLLFNKIKKGIKGLLETKNYETDKIDKVILVGGTAYIPMIRDFVHDLFKKAPYSDKDLAKLVAMGAALIADDQDNKITVHDIISHSLGIEIIKEKFEIILAKNNIYPVTQSKKFTTTVDFQKEVDINIFEGEDTDNVDNNEFYGSFALDNIESAKAGVPQIEVKFAFDSSRTLIVTATDLNSGSSKTATVKIDKGVRRVKPAPPSHDIVLVIDHSGSMSGSNLEEAKKACCQMIDTMVDFNYNRLAAVAFQSTTKILSYLSTEGGAIKSSINSLVADGGTNMSGALSNVKGLFNGASNIPIAIMFTDGMPDSAADASREAVSLKNQGVRLITIGIGSGADGNYLKNLASHPSDYHFVSNINGLKDVFQTIMNGLKVI